MPLLAGHRPKGGPAVSIGCEFACCSIASEFCQLHKMVGWDLGAAIHALLHHPRPQRRALDRQVPGSIRAAMEKIAEPYEVIVVDDASTDSTHQIAIRWEPAAVTCCAGFPPAQASTAGLQSLRILRVELRNIAAVRNAGACAAPRATSSSSLTPTPKRTNRPSAAPSQPCAPAPPAAAAFPRSTSPIPLWARLIIWFAVKAGPPHPPGRRLLPVLHARCLHRDRRLQRKLARARTSTSVRRSRKSAASSCPRPTVVTSSRKLKVVTAWQVIRLLATIVIRGPRYESKWIIDILYGPRAEACRKRTET